MFSKTERPWGVYIGNRERMKIRKIGKNETGIIVSLFNQYRLFYDQPSDVAGAAYYLNERLRQHESIIYVAFEERDGESPVGFVQLYPLYSSISMTKNWILNDLFVEPESRSMGVGRSLIEAAMNMAKTRNAKFLQLETAADNYGAQRLYEGIGFEKQSIGSEFFLYRIVLD